MTQKIAQFWGEARAEFRQISWPTREEAFRLTGVVVVFSLLLSIFLGAWDVLFRKILESIFIG